MKRILLITIFVLAIFLRFFQLGINPPSPTWDEVAWGYNAYALGLNGRDEFGRFLPYDYLESFGDFKPPLYAYLSIVPVKIFGLNEFSIRFISAFFGSLSVLFTFFLAKRIFFKSNDKEFYALVASFLLAVSPWHILLSRAAFEANVASFFVILGIFLFLKSIHTRPFYLLFSSISFALTFYTFNSARVFVPMLAIVLFIAFFKDLIRIKKYVASAVLVAVIMIAPIMPFLLSPQASLRFKEVNIFSDIDVIKISNQEIANDNNAAWSKIIHNRRLKFAGEFVKHYFDNLSFNFLFVKGDGNPKFSTQSVGQMYLWELPFLIAGLIFIIRKREQKGWLILGWIFIAILPAAFARETPHALRIENSLPAFQLITAYGVVSTFLIIKKSKISSLFTKYFLLPIFILTVLFNISFFIENYFIHYPKQYSSEWQYGYKNVYRYITENEKKYKNIYLSKHQGRPYAYLLFYKKYDPELFRENSYIERDTFGFVNVLRFDKYYFERTIIDHKELDQTLYVDSPVDVPPGVKIKKTFYNLKGDKVYEAYTLN